MDNLEQTILITETYEILKEDLRQKLQEVQGSFVYIGYRLKQIRDSKAYMEGGYSTIFDFAKDEYNLEKSITSRFIAINDKYSVNGYSLELKEEFKNLGSSKLAEMLTLNEADYELITEQTKVKEIRELKNFDKEAPAPDEVEEEWKADNESLCPPLQKCIVDYLGNPEKRETLNKVLKLLTSSQHVCDNVPAMCELINPTGYATHKKGLVFMFMYDIEQGVKFKLVTEQSPRTISWIDFIHEMFLAYNHVLYAENPWVEFYGEVKEPEPVKEEPKEEPVQTPPTAPKRETSKVEETQQNSAVATVATDEKTEEIEEEPEEEEPVAAGPKEPEPEEPKTEQPVEKSEQIVDIVDNPKVKLIEEAEELADSLEIYGWNDEDEPVTLEEVLKTKEAAEKLAAVLEQLEHLMKEEQ